MSSWKYEDLSLPAKLSLIHTSPTLAPLFNELCAKWMPEVNIFHMVDESLIKNTVQARFASKGDDAAVDRDGGFGRISRRRRGACDLLVDW